LGYLFFGIAIISDIFMESIEQITSESKTIELWDSDTKSAVFIDVPVWNATVANLTLMALGSSAPEILLSIISTVKDLEAEPPDLGPSTIVGSAAFNLLVISALSILSVEDEPKKIYDLGVFAVTSLASLWAYIWVFICLSVSSENEVTLSEGWWTLIFFFMLIVFAYTADRVYACIEDKKKSFEEIEEKERLAEFNIKKN
jgi:solute carrier family 8 (sodium/calcium exchanger)